MPDEFAEYVLDQLRGLTGLTCRRMFGGAGLYQGDRFFGILHQGRLYLKTSPATVGPYRERGQQPFQPNARQTLKNYHEVPADVLENARELDHWARTALSLA